MNGVIKYRCKCGAMQYYSEFVTRKHAQNAGSQRHLPPALFTQQHRSVVTIHQSRLAHQPLSLSLYLEWLERSNSLLATPRQEGSDSSHRSQDRELINGWSVTETGGVGGWAVGGVQSLWVNRGWVECKEQLHAPFKMKKKKSHGDLGQPSQTLHSILHYPRLKHWYCCVLHSKNPCLFLIFF